MRNVILFYLQRNPSDYLARKREKEEEEQREKNKYPRRSKSTADKDYAAKRRSYVIDRKGDESDAAAREKRLNRRSLNFDHKPPPERPQQPVSRVTDGQSNEQRRKERPLSVEVNSGTKPTTSPSTSPTRLSSTKKTRAPPPPCSPTGSSAAGAKVSPNGNPLKESRIPVPQSPSGDTPRRPPRRKGSGKSPEAPSPTGSVKSGRKSFLFSSDPSVKIDKKSDAKQDKSKEEVEVKTNSEPSTVVEKEKEIVPEIKKTVENNIVIEKKNTTIEVQEEIVLPVQKPTEESAVDTVKLDNLEVNRTVKSDIPVVNGDFEVDTSDLTKKDNSVDTVPDTSDLTTAVENIVTTQDSCVEEDQVSIPESLDPKKETPAPSASRDNLSLDIPSSDTVSLCSVDSIPPDLPQTAPPNLPFLSEPNGPQSPIEEEVVEIVTSPRVETSPVETVIVQEDSSPSFSEFKSEFLSKSSNSTPVIMEEVTVEPQTNGESLDMVVNDLAIDVKMKKQIGSDEDSDLSDIENQNGSFSPGKLIYNYKKCIWNKYFNYSMIRNSNSP